MLSNYPTVKYHKYYTEDVSVYFDQNHTGYLLDKDAEEILHAIGLSQSRAQVCYLTIQLLNITNITNWAA